MFRLLDHTADVILYAEAKDLKNLIKELLMGLFSLMGQGREKQGSIVIEHEAPDERFFFVELLNKIIAIAEAEGITPVNVEILELEPWKVRLKLYFEKKYPNNKVKAATYWSFKYEPYKVWVTLDI